MIEIEKNVPEGPHQCSYKKQQHPYDKKHFLPTN